MTYETATQLDVDDPGGWGQLPIACRWPLRSPPQVSLPVWGPPENALEARVPKPVDARTELEGRRGFESWSQLGLFTLKPLLNATLFPFIDGLSRELNDTQ